MSRSSLSNPSVLVASGVLQGSTQGAVGQPTSRVPDCVRGKGEKMDSAFAVQGQDRCCRRTRDQEKFRHGARFRRERSFNEEQVRAIILRLEPLSHETSAV